MAIFGGSQQTAQIRTGNVRTTYDLYNSAAPNNGLLNPLGLIYYDVDGALGSPTSTPGSPAGAPSVYKYVLYKSTTNPALVAGPGVVYWTDNTFTTVSGDIATDGLTKQAADAAGFLMPNTVDISGLTATILNNGGNGSGVWICVGGYLKGAIVPASTAAGDMLYGSGQFAMTRIAAHGTQTADKIVALAITAVSSNKSDLMVQPLNCL